MLSEFNYSELEKQATSLYANLESQLYKEIVKRINAVGYANTVVENNANILQEMGVLYSDIVTTIAQETDSTYDKISQILYNAGVKSISYDDEIYIAAGLNPIKINQSTSMVQLINATIANTSGNLKNLVNTTANTTQTSFYNAMNLAYLEVTTGSKSYSQAIIDAIENLSKYGLTIEYPSGYKSTLENAVKTNILTSTSQMCGKLQEMRAEELGWDLMELTAHAGARPSHAEWQGGIVSLSGKSGYLSKKSIGYGKVDGFKGINCRHDWYPYYEGSSRAYSQELLDEYKNATVTYNGETMSLYDATQLQRSMEKQIRADKRQLISLQEAMKNTSLSSKDLESYKTAFARKTLYYNTHKNELQSLVNQTNLAQNNVRTIVANYSKSVSSNVSAVTKIANQYNNSNIVGTVVNGTKITKIGEHIISRTYARNVTVENVVDCLQNPIKYGIKRTDNSQQIIGKECVVVMNMETGKLITVIDKKYGV